MKKSNDKAAAAAAAPEEAAVLYEVTCHSIEIDALICYRTHRLRLTKSKADAILSNQPDALKFIGI
jgi:hypothetical protein